MNKQIEEMAKDLCRLSYTCEECQTVSSMKKDRCKAKIYAKRAYEKGYRKQSEGEWVEERREWDMPPFFYVDYTCSVCQQREQNKSPYCRWCGAKMKGGE